MELVAEVLRVLDTRMDIPQAYGWFHLMWWAIVFIAGVGLCIWHRHSGSDNRVRNVVFGVAVTVIILEIYKIINYGFSYEDGVSFSFVWYAFPWQFCSTPMYIGFLAGIIRKGKIHESLCAYLATFAVFAGTAVMIYPGDVFIDTVGINIQTMVCHGSMITIGIYLFYSGYVKLEFKTLLKALPVFIINLAIAMILNEVAHRNGIGDFNMFYISPYQASTLPVYSLVHNAVPFPFNVMIYVTGFTLAAGAILLIAMGVRAVGRKMFKAKVAV